VQDLALEICDIDLVAIDNADCSNTCRRQIQGGRAAEAAGTDKQDSTVREATLTLGPYFGQREMACVSEEIRGRQIPTR